MSRHLFDGFGIETLERRRMMAGNVSVDVTGGGDLRIDGDDASNELAIRATEVAGRYEVEGLNGTTINGQSSVIVDGVDDDMRINLRDGDNQLLITAEGPDGEQANLVVADDLQFSSRNGSDLIVLDNVQVNGNVSMNTRGGDDAVLGWESQINGDFRANTDSGNDIVGFDRCILGGQLRASMGSGDDAVIVFNSAIGDRANLSMGSGNDSVGTSDVTFDDDLRINGGSGIDQVLNDDSSVADDLRLQSVESEQDDAANVISAVVDEYPAILAGIELIFGEGTGF